MKYFSAKYCTRYFLVSAALIVLLFAYLILFDWGGVVWQQLILLLMLLSPMLLLAFLYWRIALTQKIGNHWLNAMHTIGSIGSYLFLLYVVFLMPGPFNDVSLRFSLTGYSIEVFILLQIVCVILSWFFTRNKNELITSK